LKLKKTVLKNTIRNAAASDIEGLQKNIRNALKKIENNRIVKVAYAGVKKGNRHEN